MPKRPRKCRSKWPKAPSDSMTFKADADPQKWAASLPCSNFLPGMGQLGELDVDEREIDRWQGLFIR